MRRRLCAGLLLIVCPVLAWSAPADDSRKVVAATPANTIAASDTLDDANALFRKGDFEHAILKYRQILQATPAAGEAWAGLIRVYLKQKDVKQASETAEQARMAADSPPVRVALGEVYFRQGRIHDAEVEWVQVIKAGHPEARAYLGLGIVRQVISKYKSAREMITEAYRLDPADPEIHGEYAETLSRGERIKYLDKYLGGENNEDAETLKQMRQYLAYLKARERNAGDRCRLVGAFTGTETPLVPLLLDPTHLRGFGLHVLVNDAKSKLLLDSGASGILINRRLAEKAGVTKLSDSAIRGIGDNGDQSGYTALAASLKMGGMEFQNCTVRVIDKRSVVNEDGLIGPDVFARFLVDIDYPNRKLRLSELPTRPQEDATPIALESDRDDGPNPRTQDRYIAPEMQSYTPIYRFGHDLLIPTSIGEGPGKLFLLDTGGFRNLISIRAAAEVTKVRSDPSTRIRGISGEVKKIYSADKADLRFGNLRQDNLDVTAFDLKPLSDDLGTEVSGILGFTTLILLDFKIDYRDGLVQLTYDHNR